MDAFAPDSPDWTDSAAHAFGFCCPTCGASVVEAERVWINRRSPVLTETYRRKWQEFYGCRCGAAWWAWSDERPPSPSGRTEAPASPDDRGGDGL